MDKILSVTAVKNMLIGGYNELNKNIKTINELNVFPVPDGDTGTNMLKTLSGGLSMINSEFLSASEVINAFSNGAVYGARGNSGVILSEFFKGFAKSLIGLELSVNTLKNAFISGYKCAYNAVETPVEGTILTVIREASDNACAYDYDNVVEYLQKHLEFAKISLKNTINLLPALKEANVVDSGGAGYVTMISGFISALNGEEVAFTLDEFEYDNSFSVDYSLFSKDSILTYGYCTEFLLRLQTYKVDVLSFDETIIINHLKSIGGDSIVCSKTGDIVKVHVHTKTPGDILNFCQKFGEFLTLKIENMTLQHAETLKKPKKRLAIVAVASGDGVEDTFRTLGADYVISGGQTLNPSTSDFIKAYDEVNAENIVVLPNNKNVILSAKQSQNAYNNSKVYVLETKTIQQGYVALSLFNSSSDDLMFELESLKSALEEVISIDVTYAVRDAVIGGKSVKKGEFMAISDNKILSTGSDKLSVALSAISEVEDIKNRELLTVFFGADVTPNDKYAFEEEFTKKYEDVEFCSYNGNQDIYSFLICIE